MKKVKITKSLTGYLRNKPGYNLGSFVPRPHCINEFLSMSLEKSLQILLIHSITLKNYFKLIPYSVKKKIKKKVLMHNQEAECYLMQLKILENFSSNHSIEACNYPLVLSSMKRLRVLMCLSGVVGSNGVLFLELPMPI